MICYGNPRIIILEKCYEYFACRRTDCVRHKFEDKKCWEIDGTLCDTHDEVTKVMQEEGENKSEICKLCIYYRQNNWKN